MNGFPSDALTERQARVLEFIREHTAKKGYPPTLREIGAYMSIRSTNGVNDHLRALERKGYLIVGGDGYARTRALKPTGKTGPDEWSEPARHYDEPQIAPEGYRLFGRLPGRRLRTSVAA